MTQFTNDPLIEDSIQQNAIEQINASKARFLQVILMLRGLGYGLLFLAFFDLVAILIPPNFMNPSWELQMFGELIERVPVPLIGLTLVLLGKRENRSKWESSFLMQLLSLLALLSGIVLFLLLPLGLVNSIRVSDAMTAQIKNQVGTKREQIQQVRKRLAEVSTVGEMEQLISSLDNQGRTPDIKDAQSVTEIKGNLSLFITRSEKSMVRQADQAISSQRLPLIKNSVKWSFGALVAGVLFINLWRWSWWVWR
ncbi:MAG: hypothetical protein HC851_15740 [Acaryochloris sp. RU_4_1]|nr:hypothetical protein [Acaryochloris sp. RU_4_1]NJR56158.1 hypothetical protein [Acaryochloris sp. CRU_2_0]